jgi:hypothetical protein
VNHVEAVSKAKGVLQKDDVLLSIDGNRIANDGTVAFRKRSFPDQGPPLAPIAGQQRLL